MSDGPTIIFSGNPRTGGLWRLRSLRVRFVFAISALVGMVLISLVAVLALTGRRELRREIERRAESHAALAVRPVCEAFETYYASGYTKFRELVTDVSELNPDLVGIDLYDTSGTLLFSSEEFEDNTLGPKAGERGEGQRAVEPRLLGAVKGLEIEAWSSGAEAEAAFAVVVPYIEEWGRHRYSVVFRISYDGLHEATRAAAVRLLWLAAGSLLLGILIAMLLARQSLGAVEQRAAGARDVGEGHLDRRLDLRTGDEFEVLATTFNHMAARLSSTIADLEASNRVMQQSNVELKALDRFKSDLLANVSHELRTPLTSLRGYTEAMSEELLGPLTDGQREALEVGTRNIERLLGMIDELLSFARFESREIELDRRPTDLVEIAAQVVGSVKAARGPELQLELVAEAGLLPVDADPSRIAQVLDNLVTNAVKFTPPDGRIELRLARLGDAVRVEIADTGIGIASDEVGRIFDRFYQIEASTTRKYGGIGLGLAIVRKILDAHGCAIEVESVVGEGTIFRFQIPVLEQAETVRSNSARAVVVDDDAAFARALATDLESKGWLVRVASSCEGAGRLVEDFDPDLVLLDRLLPDGDGFDLLERWRQQLETKHLPVVVVSVRPEEALAMRLGASLYLVKPIETTEVVARALEIAGPWVRLDAVLLGVGDPTLLAAAADRLEATGRPVTQVDSWGELSAMRGIAAMDVEGQLPSKVAESLDAAGLLGRVTVVVVGELDDELRERWSDAVNGTRFLAGDQTEDRLAAVLRPDVTSGRRSA